MHSISIPAHFNGEHIQLDVPFDFTPNTLLMVTVLPDDDPEREDWIQISLNGLSGAYGDDEPEYTLDDVKVMSPMYRGR